MSYETRIQVAIVAVIAVALLSAWISKDIVRTVAAAHAMMGAM